MAFHILVLAGGSGTRLWPMSRRATPKHLLPLAPGGKTLLRATVERVQGLGDSVSVVTAADQAGMCEAELADLRGVNIIAEQEPRGTGPALALATLQIAAQDPEAVIASVHADHYVADDEAYRDAVASAAGWALSTEGLAAVGLAPTYPSTAFGYVAIGDALNGADWRSPHTGPGGADSIDAELRARNLSAYRSPGFVEKPDQHLAETFLASGSHLWNTGLFAWTADSFKSELRDANPDIADRVEWVIQQQQQGDVAEAAATYSGVKKIAVDPLIFEKTRNLTVVKATFPWSDVGSWNDLHDVRSASGESDGSGNVARGDVVLVDTENTMVESAGGRLVAIAGVKDLVVVDTEDALLIISAGQAQKVKEIAETLDLRFQ